MARFEGETEAGYKELHLKAVAKISELKEEDNVLWMKVEFAKNLHLVCEKPGARWRAVLEWAVRAG